MKTLKDMYNLTYEKNSYNTSLVEWYNQVIDKTVDELNVTDIAKMIRQNILTNVTLEKAFALFFSNPYDGEFLDGDLLETINSTDISTVDKKLIKEMTLKLPIIEREYVSFDWDNEEAEKLYYDNLQILKKSISLLI
jgi:hypothetical protein